MPCESRSSGEKRQCGSRFSGEKPTERLSGKVHRRQSRLPHRAASPRLGLPTLPFSRCSATLRGFFTAKNPVSENANATLPDNAPWIVMKFGGTSVATAARWRNILELAASRRAEGARVLIVVSALSGITDGLKQLCTHAKSK